MADDDPYGIEADLASEDTPEELAAMARHADAKERAEWERRAYRLSNDLARLAHDLDNDALRDIQARFDAFMQQMRVYPSPANQLDGDIPF